MSKLKSEYRDLANPQQLREFLNGDGILTKRQEVADQHNYDWHARKLTFEQHFRGQVLMCKRQLIGAPEITNTQPRVTCCF